MLIEKASFWASCFTLQQASTQTIQHDLWVIFFFFFLLLWCLWPKEQLHLNTCLFFLTIYSKGRRKSFWKRKLGNSPFSRNFIASCRKESTQKNATSSLGLQPHCNKTVTKNFLYDWPTYNHTERVFYSAHKMNARFLSAFPWKHVQLLWWDKFAPNTRYNNSRSFQKIIFLSIAEEM